MATKRLDSIKFDGPRRKTPQGGLSVSANLTRIGVFTYHDAKGTPVNEYRPAEEVFHADSLDTLRLAPVTIGHPGMVGPDNFRDLAVGTIGENVRPDGIYVTANVVVQDGKTVAGCEKGDFCEVSCGYTVDLEHKPGVFDGIPYEYVHRNIRYNHVGLGPKNWGRAGNEVRLHLDGQGDVIDPRAERVEAITYPPPVADKSDSNTQDQNQARFDAITAERDALKVQNQNLAAEVVKEKTRADALEAKSADLVDPSKVAELVANRVALENSARVIIGPDFKSTKADEKDATKRVPMSEAEIMTAAIVKSDPTFKADGRSVEYIRCRFDMAAEQAEKAQASMLTVVTAVTQPKVDGKQPEKSRLELAHEAHAKSLADQSKAGAPAGAVTRK